MTSLRSRSRLPRVLRRPPGVRGSWAVLRPWAEDRADGTVRQNMTKIMHLRLPLDTRLLAEVPADGLTMLVCERRIEGVGPDGKPVRLSGVGCTVVRAQTDGAWRIAADAWWLADTV